MVRSGAGLPALNAAQNNQERVQATWLRQARASNQVIKSALKESGRLNLIAGS